LALVDERLAKLAHGFYVAADATRVENAALAGAVELTTHGWDIGLARHPAHRIPESLAEDVLALVWPRPRRQRAGRELCCADRRPQQRLRQAIAWWPSSAGCRGTDGQESRSPRPLIHLS